MSRTRKRIPIPKSLRELVWNTYVGHGKGISTCFCGSPITPFTFECGHITSHANGGDTSLGNLRPICSSCNKSMGTTNLFEFVETLGSNPYAISIYRYPIQYNYTDFIWGGAVLVKNIATFAAKFLYRFYRS